MTKDPSSCVPSDSAQHAARIMRDQDAGIVPVIDNELSRKVVGVVTDRDLFIALATRNARASELTMDLIAQRPVHSCEPDDDVHEAFAFARLVRVVVDTDQVAELAERRLLHVAQPVRIDFEI